MVWVTGLIAWGGFETIFSLRYRIIYSLGTVRYVFTYRMVFGMDHPRYHEPWTYGPEALANFIKYDSLRYTLIPYIYSNAYQLYKTARPMMTPLVMDYPQDENTYQLTRQYMFGPWMMVCPVTTKGALSQHVYFPGGEWFDYETGERYEGRQYKSFLTPLDVLPIYIKSRSYYSHATCYAVGRSAPCRDDNIGCLSVRHFFL